MREQRCVLVAALARPLDPLRKAGMELGAARLREALVGDLARQRVLERVFGLALERGPRAPADEVTVLEDAEVGLLLAEQLVHRAGPEDSADDCGGLESGLVRRLEQIDARGEDRLHRIGHGESGRQRRRAPRAVRPLQHALVDQAADDLLDEERIPLGCFQDQVPDLGKLDGEQPLDEHAGIVRGQRIEP